jgi:hypothetical protein
MVLPVEGLVPIALVGVLGALISEALRIGAYMREKDKLPSGANLASSIIYVIVGAAVVLYGVEKTSALEVAQLGAAFPLIWSAAVRALVTPPDEGIAPGATPDVWQYTGWRFS